MKKSVHSSDIPISLELMSMKVIYARTIRSNNTLEQYARTIRYLGEYGTIFAVVLNAFGMNGCIIVCLVIRDLIVLCMYVCVCVCVGALC